MGSFSGRAPKAAYATISPGKALSELQHGAILVDVRTRLEWNAGHAPEARHIPLEMVGRRASELPAGAHIITFCLSGHRSAIAAQGLANHGFAVSSIVGGIPAWKAVARPSGAKRPATRTNTMMPTRPEGRYFSLPDCPRGR